MIYPGWEIRNTVVCVDSYDSGVLQGRFYNPSREAENFSSLSQFLVKMEEVLDQLQKPQAYTQVRKFSSLLQPEAAQTPPDRVFRGAQATFDLQVIFRQHTSWQGVLSWREGKAQHSFRSVLELVLLLDSALRSLEGSGVA
ncbi:MAG: hypothetical protein IKJ84_04590 [Oscillospiraceae bacterium]|nr:hypothetical protein [Oscillospiraceae bacterium]